jgi:hypothetical protein
LKLDDIDERKRNKEEKRKKLEERRAKDEEKIVAMKTSWYLVVINV